MTDQLAEQTLQSPPSDGSLPHVCVIIPCHNRADTVAEAVQSVLDQDYPSLDVIVVDDASTDGTAEVVRAIADNHVRLETNRGPRGPSSARNHGVAVNRTHRQAAWIAFQDSDDVWLPGKLRAQMEALTGSACVASYCGMLIKADARPDTPVQDRQPQPWVTHREGDILPSLTQGSFISTQMLVIRRDVFEAVGGFDEDLNALVDWELMLRVAQLGPVSFINQDLVVQRMSENSITRSSRKRLAAQEYVLQKHHALLARYPAALARHHHRLAGGYRMFRDWRPAADHAVAAAQVVRGPLMRVLGYRAYALYLRLRAALS